MAQRELQVCIELHYTLLQSYVPDSARVTSMGSVAIPGPLLLTIVTEKLYRKFSSKFVIVYDSVRRGFTARLGSRWFACDDTLKTLESVTATFLFLLFLLTDTPLAFIMYEIGPFQVSLAGGVHVIFTDVGVLITTLVFSTMPATTLTKQILY